MAFTIVKKLPNHQVDYMGYTAMSVITAQFDNSYAAGGLSLKASDFGFTPGFKLVHVAAAPTAGFTFDFDYTNNKLKAFTPVRQYTATFDPASLAATTSRDDAITFTGVAATDVSIAVIPPNAALASVVVQNHRVTGANTITARLTNPSAGAVDVASGTWTAYVAQANGAGYEVAASTDLSAVTARVVAFAAVV